MMKKKFWSVGMIIPLAAAAAVSTAPAAAATVPGAGRVVTEQNACSDFRSNVRLTARPFTNANAQRRIELTLRLTTNRPLPAWQVAINRVNRNNMVVDQLLNERAFTSANRRVVRGSLEAMTRTANRPGPDFFVARARHIASGETCLVRVTVRNNLAPNE
jgi:hypothetical protein